METYADAIVTFADDFVVAVDDYVYSGEMIGLKVRLDGNWVHVQSDSGSGADTFPLSAIKCIAWTEYTAEATGGP